jgi:hypothetical protein
VLFLRALSDTFGGVRIAAAALYGPGVTVRSFSRDLHRDLLSSDAGVIALQRLHIPLDVPTTEETELSAMEAGGRSKEQADRGETVSDAFDDLLASNRNFLEGTRGVLTFLVTNY